MASVAEAGPPDEPKPANSRSDMAFATDHIAGETLQLLIDATWHPTLGAPYRWWQTRQLARVMDIRPRPGPGSTRQTPLGTRSYPQGQEGTEA